MKKFIIAFALLLTASSANAALYDGTTYYTNNPAAECPSGTTVSAIYNAGCASDPSPTVGQVICGTNTHSSVDDTPDERNCVNKTSLGTPSSNGSSSQASNQNGMIDGGFYVNCYQQYSDPNDSNDGSPFCVDNALCNPDADCWNLSRKTTCLSGAFIGGGDGTSYECNYASNGTGCFNNTAACTSEGVPDDSALSSCDINIQNSGSNNGPDDEAGDNSYYSSQGCAVSCKNAHADCNNSKDVGSDGCETDTAAYCTAVGSSLEWIGSATSCSNNPDAGVLPDENSEADADALCECASTHADCDGSFTTADNGCEITKANFTSGADNYAWAGCEAGLTGNGTAACSGNYVDADDNFNGIDASAASGDCETNSATFCAFGAADVDVEGVPTESLQWTGDLATFISTYNTTPGSVQPSIANNDHLAILCECAEGFVDADNDMASNGCEIGISNTPFINQELNSGTGSTPFLWGKNFGSDMLIEITQGQTGDGIIVSSEGQMLLGSGVEGDVPDISAILDIRSTDKGILIPRLTNAQRDAIPSPATSLLIFNTEEGAYQFYTGTEWASMGGASTVSGQSSRDRVITLQPDFGAAINADPYNNGTNAKGTLTVESGDQFSLAEEVSYYRWTTGQESEQIIQLFTELAVPVTGSGITNPVLEFDYRVAGPLAYSGYIKASIASGTGGVLLTSPASYSGEVLVTNSWETMIAPLTVPNADDTMKLIIEMLATSGSIADLGTVRFKYSD